MRSTTLLENLAAHIAHDRDEEAHLARIRAFVAAHENGWWKRATQAGHVTASAWVVNAAGTHALLLHHAKLNLWLQPGGHLDDDDRSPAAGALREAIEETGLADLALTDARIFDVDVHSIPARTHEPAHLHYDLRYRIIARDDRVAISSESLGARWIALAELAGPAHERSIARMAEKSLQSPTHSRP